VVGASFGCYNSHPSRLPAECILPLIAGWYVHYFPIVFVCRLETSETSLASEPAVLATLSALLLEESTPSSVDFNSSVAGVARTNLVFDCSRAASSGKPSRSFR